MRKQHKRLPLNREAVRILASDQLVTAMGGEVNIPSTTFSVRCPSQGVANCGTNSQPSACGCTHDLE